MNEEKDKLEAELCKLITKYQVIKRIAQHNEDHSNCAQIIPGISSQIRAKRLPCAKCEEGILKGEWEIRVISRCSRYGPSFSHYHPKCFLRAILKEVIL